MLTRGLGLVSIGVFVGLAGSYWANKLLQQLLFGVEPYDPTTFIAATLGFGLIGLMACMIPAWRATRVDPVLTLQEE